MFYETLIIHRILHKYIICVYIQTHIHAFEKHYLKTNLLQSGKINRFQFDHKLLLWILIQLDSENA